MKNKFIMILSCCLLAVSLPGAVWALSEKDEAVAVNIKMKQLSWQEYEFAVMTNVLPAENWEYYWTIDGQTYSGEQEWRQFFNSGAHTVQVKVVDAGKKVHYDTINLAVDFWTLSNNRLWWTLYLTLSLLVISYWILKVYYLWNKRRLGRRVKIFLDLLDEHGWTEKIIKNLKAKM